MAKVLYLDSVAGVAGDMFTAAFVDAGLVSVEELNELPIALGLRGVEIVAEKVLRASVEATRMSILDENGDWKQRLSGHHHHGHEHNGHTHLENTNLILDDHAEHWHVHYTEIDAAIRDSSLALCVKELARKILRILGEAEASVHGV
ncbi:MAG TPA: nickel insertion protein, partial [Pyrinomonadaceae bacterium]|nr:nickel insertion protein [Pyrinomonadaceae bacterium]